MQQRKSRYTGGEHVLRRCFHLLARSEYSMRCKSGAALGSGECPITGVLALLARKLAKFGIL